MKYGRLKFVKTVGKDRHGNVTWECLCDCGTTKTYFANALKSGATKSCGCLTKERTSSGIIDRFNSYYEPIPESGCWIWTGSASTYGKLGITVNGKVKHVGAHRLSWELHYGPIPKGLHVCHKCDIPLCVNPHHLFLGTPLDNIHDMIQKGRSCTVPPPPTHGEKHPNAILTSSTVIAIRKDKRSARIIAAEYGTSKSNVIGIRSGERWGWLA